MESAPGSPTCEAPAAVPAPRERLVSLDAFRGATMALMILVNNAGDEKQTYAPLLHAEWHGWTITDVVFPSFLWIVGVAMTLSFARRLEAGTPPARMFRQVLRRAAVLFGLGLFIYGFPYFDLSTQRILGVLQRIAICYLIAAAIYLKAGLRGQIAWIAGLLGVYWMLMSLAPVPGFGVGRLDVEGNFAHYVDRIVLGRHNYENTRTWDPEGIVSTLPAVATTLLGVLAGRILRAKRALAERTTWLFFAGNLLLAAGLVCGQWLPINKKLWTSSYCLFMAGLDFVLFAIFLWWCDGLGRERPVRPLVILGRNAISVYVVAELLEKTLWVARAGPGVSLHVWIYDRVYRPLASPPNASLLWALSIVVLMYLLAYAMYRRRWFVRV